MDIAVAAGDFERNLCDLPRPSWRREWLLDAPDLEDVDLGGAERQRPPDRDRVDEAAVEVVGARDGHRREKPWDRARGEHRGGEGALLEPHPRAVLDPGSNALEGDFELAEFAHGQVAVEDQLQRRVREQMRALPGDPRRLTHRSRCGHRQAGW